ncbi:helix-turn-helix domain-containing protein [Sutcliffiella halmapala]
MHEGRIIKYFRQKAKLTQQQLGNGICSDTHISKIERGMTEYSSEITVLLSKRLGINIEEEIERYHNIKKLLSRWHDAIIMQRMEDIENIKDELEEENLIKISDYQVLYELLKARYHLLHNNFRIADKIIKDIQKEQRKLPPYESNLLKHNLGMYYLSNKEMTKAVHILKKINFKDYNNPEYYLTLATSYLGVNSKVMAYYYADKSLEHFIKSNNYLNVIDAEMIMLMTHNGEDQRDFPKVAKQYEKLLQTCDLCHALGKKALVLHNFAYEHYCRKDFEAASRLYQKSMLLKEKKSAAYLSSLEGYVRSSHEGNYLSTEELAYLGHEGLSIAREINLSLYMYSFQLLLYLIHKQKTEYYNFLTTKALPYFKKSGYVTLVKRYEKELFNNYFKYGHKDFALKLADILINDVEIQEGVGSY